MAKSINLQANKVESIVTINYTTPSSSILDSVQSSSSDITNYSQRNETSLRKCNMTGSGALINLGNQDQNVNPFDSETTDSIRSGFNPERRYSSTGSNLRYAPYPRDERDSSYENVRAESRRTERQERYFHPNNRTDVEHERSFYRNDRLDAAWMRVVRPTTPTSEKERSSLIQESAQSARMNSSHGHFGRSSKPNTYRVPPSDFSANNNYDSEWIRVVRPTTPTSESSRIEESARSARMDSSHRYFGRSFTPETYRIPPSDFAYRVFEENDGYGLANWYAKYED